MTEGAGGTAGTLPRLRIKGHAASVLRFFSISMAFMVLWILVTSQLGHYSKLFGPQILLQLNLAFYLPSIPVLLLSGSLERALDDRLGPIRSIALRLNGGLAGCLLVAALFPLLPGLHPGDGPLWPLLAAVAVLGGLSAVAFSTSYQLVQFFRAADTIGLGVGCVGAGPLVLAVQLALEVGPSPAKWQWIAMYEVSAGLIAAGLLSSVSLCGQYWDLLNESASRGAAAAAAAAGGGGASGGADGGGIGDGDEGRVPLLMAVDGGGASVAVTAAAGAAAAAERDMEAAEWRLHGGSTIGGGGSGGLFGSPLSLSPPRHRHHDVYGMQPYGSGGLRVRAAGGCGGGGGGGGPFTLRPHVAPDPSNVFSLLSPELDARLRSEAEDDQCEQQAPPVLLRRSVSAGIERGGGGGGAAAARWRREALRAAGLDRSQGGHSRSGASSLTAQFTAVLRTSSRSNTTTPSHNTAKQGTQSASPGGAGAGGTPAATPLAVMMQQRPPPPPPSQTTQQSHHHLPAAAGAAGPLSSLSGMASAPPAVGVLGRRCGRQQYPVLTAAAAAAAAADGTRVVGGTMVSDGDSDDACGGGGGGALQFGVPDLEPVGAQPAGATLYGIIGSSNGVVVVGSGGGNSFFDGSSSFATPAASSTLSRALLSAGMTGASTSPPPGVAAAAVVVPGGGIETPRGGGGGGGSVGGDGGGACAGLGPRTGSVAAVEAMTEAEEKEEEEATCKMVDVRGGGLQVPVTSAGAGGPPLTVQQEVIEVVRGAWQVLLGFLVSVTTLYIVFPFFTYVPPAGALGDSLPQVLFYARLFTDLAGRLLPRVRALQLRSGAAVLALAGLSAATAVLLFLYILAPAGWRQAAPGWLLRNDAVPVVLVVALWLAGGYTNTISNMLAPALVAPALAGRASAVMALAFNVAHIGGLVIAAAMAAGIFGDVVG